MLETFHVSIFQYDAHLEFRFPERREEHDGGVAHLCTVDGTDQREGYCAWASLRSGGVEIQFSSNIGDAHHHAVDARTEDAVVLENCKGKIDIKDVSFSYTPEKPLIRNFNLHVKPGQRIAIVGPTGCGKTTLINLLMRFYDIDSGSILIDGKSIYNITRSSLRKSYGMVLQENRLYNATVRENIAYGRPEASIEEIKDAARKSFIDSFIERLPDGYDTVISEEGTNLSQGQRQLICIARVMLCRPRMLILDEATSSIDTRTEIKVQQAFNNMMEGRTSFIVAHRLSTVKEADLILVMKDGNIIEQGTHSKLMENGGFYRKLYDSQFSTAKNTGF